MPSPGRKTAVSVNCSQAYCRLAKFCVIQDLISALTRISHAFLTRIEFWLCLRFFAEIGEGWSGAIGGPRAGGKALRQESMDCGHGSAHRRVWRRCKSGCRSSVRRSTAQGVEGVGVEILPGIGGAHLKQDAAHADANDDADLEQLETDGIDLRLGPFGTLQSQAAQGLDQRVGKCGEVQAQLVALDLVCGEPVGE